MDLSYSKQDIAFQEEVRAFLDENLTAEMREAGALSVKGLPERNDVQMAWHKVLYKKGWVAPHWPKEYGGTGWSDVQNYIFSNEIARAEAPSLAPFGLKMCGPVLIGHGTKEQQDYYLPRILSGEHFWCQGYSEPGSGSDLASLQCRADSDGDDYVINGSKIWTSSAHFADHIFCLVRTDNSGKPQQGVTFLLLKMNDPGIKVEPIIMMNGDHEVNQVFFDNVRVPKTNRVGEEGLGWSVAKYLLEFERTGAIAIGGIMALDRLKIFASEEPSGGGHSLIQDPSFRRRLADVRIEAEAVEMNERRMMSAISHGGRPGPASSQLKLRGTEIWQLVDELSIEAAGHYASPDQFDARTLGSNVPAVGRDEAKMFMATYLVNRAATIYGGSSEVQRNIMAKAVLGL